LVNYFGVNVPQSLSSATTDSFGTYLLLNSEIRVDTRLKGFQIYGQAAGLIQLSVKFLIDNLNSFENYLKIISFLRYTLSAIVVQVHRVLITFHM